MDAKNQTGPTCGKTPTRLIGAIFILLALSGCEHPYQRFIPISSDNSSFALDTKTGKKCLTEPAKLDLIKQAQEVGYPFCIDLYKEAK